MTSTKWQIWINIDQTEGTTLPANSPQHEQLTTDMDGVKMELLHMTCGS